MKQLYQIRDDLADLLGVDTLEASDGPLRFTLNAFIIRAQFKYYWDFDWDDLKQYFLFNTTGGMNKYPFTPGLVVWAANGNINVTDKLFDGTNYQEAGDTGNSGAGAPAWNGAVGGLTVDGSITWRNLGPTPLPSIEPRRIEHVSVLYNNAWLDVYEGIPPNAYTLTSQMYPQRYRRINGSFELWPTPDNVYKVKVLATQALNPFAKDTDFATLDDELILLESTFKAKSTKKFKAPDALEYKADATKRLLDLRAANHGNKRYIPGKSNQLTRPMPKIVNPE